MAGRRNLNPQQFDEAVMDLDTGMSTLGEHGIRLGDSMLPVIERWQTVAHNGNIMTGFRTPYESGGQGGVYHTKYGMDTDFTRRQKPFTSYAHIDSMTGGPRHEDSAMTFDTADEAVAHQQEMSRRKNYREPEYG